MNQILRLNADLAAAAKAGLSKPRKMLEAKWFYDTNGSDLFEKITELPEYYVTRTELGILTARVDEMARGMPRDLSLVELGSGASIKTRILLDRIPQIARYMPLDISGGMLGATATRLARDYPDLAITPVAADFMEPFSFPPGATEQPKLAFFPGSTLGNLDTEGAVTLLSRVRQWPAIHSFVLGVDLVKAPKRLVAAYDDSAGVTAAFNLNILHRLNREAGASIDVEAFRHEARWNPAKSRIEMHLVALRDQRFLVDGTTFEIAAGESIHTESSHKYTREMLADLARRSGWRLAQLYTDDAPDFAVCLLTPG